jgi:hypothetical protein
MSNSWPSSPLSAVARAFNLLTCPPAPLAFDARGLPDLPQQILPLDELRTELTSDATPKPVRDLVWRDLVIRARRDGPAWVVACVGIAIPGLRVQAGRLATRWHGDTQDLDAELIAGFVERLATIDLSAPRIAGRLIDAGARAAKRCRDAEEDATTVHVDGSWSRAPQEPWDHPDWVLARAVAAAVIDPEEHLLIGATRLEEVPLQVVADKLGISVTLAASWRRKAERRLATAIAGGEMDWIDLRGRRRRADAIRRANGTDPDRPSPAQRQCGARLLPTRHSPLRAPAKAGG